MKPFSPRLIAFVLWIVPVFIILIAGHEPASADVIHGTVLEADSVVHIYDVKVVVYDSLGQNVDSTMSGGNGSFTLYLSVGVYRLTFSRAGYLGTSLDNVIVEPNEILNITVILHQTGCRYLLGDANASGFFNGLDLIYMVRVLINGTLPFYACECTPGNTWNVVGDLNGSCSFNGLDIVYAVEYFKGGADIIPCADCSDPHEWLRTYLVWDADPQDLDFHLWTPLFGSTPYDSLIAHVCYYRQGNENAPPYAELIVDDVIGFGPEQIDIYQGFPGTYVLAAYHYSGQGTIVTSNARVSILRSDGFYTIMNVPQDAAGDNWWWHICAIDGATGEITPLNLVSPDPPRPDALLGATTKE